MADSFIQSWQTTCSQAEEVPSLRKSMKEPPNALALAINLQHLPLKEAAQWAQTATEEEIKDHKGLRTTFMVVEMLFSGFTYVAPPSTEADSKKRDKLAVFDTAADVGSSVIFYTYKGESKKQKGEMKQTYIKTKRFDECAAISPGTCFHFVLLHPFYDTERQA